MTDVFPSRERRKQRGRRETDNILEKIFLALKIVTVLVIIQFIMIAGQQFLFAQRNTALDEIRTSQVTVNKSADAAREAAIAAQKSLDAAIQQSQNPESIRPFLEMVERVKRIETRLCGGLCP